MSFWTWCLLCVGAISGNLGCDNWSGVSNIGDCFSKGTSEVSAMEDAEHDTDWAGCNATVLENTLPAFVASFFITDGGCEDMFDAPAFKMPWGKDRAEFEDKDGKFICCTEDCSGVKEDIMFACEELEAVIKDIGGREMDELVNGIFADTCIGDASKEFCNKEIEVVADGFWSCWAQAMPLEVPLYPCKGIGIA